MYSCLATFYFVRSSLNGIPQWATYQNVYIEKIKICLQRKTYSGTIAYKTIINVMKLQQFQEHHI